jgi:hypothetical protein
MEVCKKVPETWKEQFGLCGRGGEGFIEMNFLSFIHLAAVIEHPLYARICDTSWDYHGRQDSKQAVII